MLEIIKSAVHGRPYVDHSDDITVGFWQYAAANRGVIEDALKSNLPLAPSQIDTRFNEAIHYAVFSGGKRLRPVLTMLGAELFGVSGRKVVHAAVGVEFVHTSSLIFDDMPAMDDAVERRGKPPLHVEFGEDLATLVAIGLLNSSYRLVTLDANGNRAASLGAVLEIVDCVGPAGMVGGQSADLAVNAAECRRCAVNRLGDTSNLKTSALVRLALRLGAIHAGADDDSLSVLTRFAECVGNAYQISDDLIDVDEDAAVSSVHVPPSPADLEAAISEARTLLVENFEDRPARHCLSELLDYIAVRRD